MPGLRQQDLDEIFIYHEPTTEQIDKYDKIRAEAKDFATTLLELAPPSAEATLAIRHVQQAVMFANAAIAIHEEK